MGYFLSLRGYNKIPHLKYKPSPCLASTREFVCNRYQSRREKRKQKRRDDVREIGVVFSGKMSATKKEIKVPRTFAVE